jgi:hypothetical protein
MENVLTKYLQLLTEGGIKWLNVQNARKRSAHPRKHGKWLERRIRAAKDWNLLSDYSNAAVNHSDPCLTREKSDLIIDINCHPIFFFQYEKITRAFQNVIWLTMSYVLDKSEELHEFWLTNYGNIIPLI